MNGRSYGRAPTRWRCAIPAAFVAPDVAGEARIADVSDTGLKLTELSDYPLPGAMVEVRLHDGTRFRGRVVWLDPYAGRAGVRVLASGAGDMARYASWVAKVALASLTSGTS